MSTRRLLMDGKNKVAQLSATMIVARLGKGLTARGYGFSSSKALDADIGQGGSISPNPLPNGITITNCYFYGMNDGGMRIAPADVTGVTINGTKMKRGDAPQSVYEYLAAHKNAAIPIIFHFD